MLYLTLSVQVPLTAKDRQSAHGHNLRRRPGAGRARSRLFVPGPGGRHARTGRSRLGAPRCARGNRRGLGGRRRDQARPAQPHQGHRPQARRAAAAARVTPIRRLGVELYPDAARHGAAHGAADGRTPRAGPRARRRSPRRTAAIAHDVGPRAGSGAARGRPRPGERQRGRGCRRVGWRRRRSRRRRDPGVAGAAARSGRAGAGPGFRAARFPAAAARRCRCAARQRARRWLRRHAARWRHRLGQDRGLLRGRGRSASGAAGRPSC